MARHDVHIDAGGHLYPVSPARTIAGNATSTAALVSMLGWLALQVPRYRRAGAERRQQLKWLYSGAAVFVGALLATALIPYAAGEAFGSDGPLANDTIELGSSVLLVRRFSSTCPSEGHLGDASYRLLQSIPTQPDALLAYLKAGKKWTNDDPPTEIGDMIRETIMPPALAAALYRLAATLPGATLVPHATNAVGRAGIGIMWTGKTAKQVYKNEWIFDRTTLQFIGERIFDPKTGQVTGASAILQQAFTAKAGQLP